MTDLAVASHIILGDEDKYYAQCIVGDIVVTVHESLTTPGAVVVDVDNLLSQRAVVYVNDGLVYEKSDA